MILWFRRYWYLALPVAFLLAAYWKIFFVWFRSDDFAWLGLKLSIDGPAKLFTAIFAPQAQGTIRILSERLPYLGFSTLFGYEVAPFRLLALTTQAASGVLLGLILQRITGSPVAAALAPMLWVLNIGMAVALCWFAANNQILAAFFLLAAFYAFLERRRAWTWTLFLLGFLALETTIVFPALLVWYCLLLDRSRLRECWPYWIPSAIFAAFHLAVIPKAPDPSYQLHWDAGVLTTLWRYFLWSLGPRRWNQLQEIPRHWDLWGSPLLVLASAAALSGGVLRRDWRGLFFLGCFVIVLGPVLPLKNHVSDYYLASGSFGIAAFFAWSVVSAWRWNRIAGALAVLCLAVSAWSGYRLRWLTLGWYLNQTQGSQALVEHVREARRRHPDQTLLLTNIGKLLFYQAIYDDAFRLYLVKDVWLAPGGSHELRNDPEAQRFTFPLADVLWSADRHAVRIYRWENSALRDITRPHLEALADTASPAPLPQWIEPGRARFAELLGTQWTPVNPENGTRMMRNGATLRAGGLLRAGAKLQIVAYAPPPLLASGPLQLTARFNGQPAPPANVSVAGEPFTLDIPIPPAVHSSRQLEIVLDCNRTVKDAKQQDVCLVISRVDIR